LKFVVAETDLKDLERAILFFIRDKIALDHFAPVIHSFQNCNHPVIVVAANRLLYRMIRDSWWFAQSRSTKLILRATLSSPSSTTERVGRIRWNQYTLQQFVRRANIGLIVMDWSEGVPNSDVKLLSRMYRWLFTGFATQLLIVAKRLDIPTVALPHGHSAPTKLVLSQHVKQIMNLNDGKLPFRDRDSYSAYVFESFYKRDIILSNSTMSGQNVMVWGSARVNDYWVNLLYSETEAAVFELATHEQRKILFFIPKWSSLVSRQATLQLVSAIVAKKTNTVIMRAHARSEASGFTKEERAELCRLGDVVFVPEDTTSPSLIKTCDVLIDAGSSIAFDAVLLGKPYVRPRYLQDSSVITIWDQLGGAHQTDSPEATVELVSDASLQPAPRDPTFDQVVFGGAGVDVLQRYRNGLLALMAR
jgi:hypothetical protein